MKNILSMILCLLAAGISTAQTTGKIIYQEKVKLEIKMDGPDSMMMAGLPKEHISKKELYFTPDVSLYQNIKNNQASQDIDQTGENGAHMVIKMDESDDKTYCDLKNNKRIEQRDFMSRKFLVESDLNKMEWKLTGHQKMILNYPCQEAVLKDTAKNVTVWFTPMIPVATGPGGYSNLPGMILEANLENGRRVTTAISIDTKEFDQKIFVKPSEGKKVTKEQFNKMVDEKRKEMQEENGGDGNVIIKIRH